MNYYREIKQELINNEITKRVKDYSKNRSDLNTYYNVGKLLSEAGKHYGEGIIKEYSKRLTSELGKGYNTTSLKRMRQFYLIIEKGATLWHLLSWSHYRILITLNDINEINYYILQIEKFNLSVRELECRIKNKEYERLDEKTKEKLINNEEPKVNDLIKNPILIKNTYDYKEISEKILQKLILEDLDNFLTELGEGFTLIELLAVIVVLAIIALIATSIVMSTIKSAKKGAAERSADSYIKQVETIVATERLDGNILEGEYIIQSDGNLCPTSGCGNSNKDKIIIDMKGTKPSSGKITISNGNVEISEKITVGTFDVVYNPTTKSYETTEKGSSSSEDDKPTNPDTPTTPTVVYRWSTDEINIGDTMNDSIKYTTDSSTLERNYYLKHVLDKDNKVTESYACATFNRKEYCLKGVEISSYGWSENEADYTGNMLILKELKDSDMSCDFSSDYSYCNNGSAGLHASSVGGVHADDTDGGCHVDVDGISYCENQ